MNSSSDYRDMLQEVFQKVRGQEGLSQYRLAKRIGITEQTISNVFSKRRNLSVPALERFLRGLGYGITFEPIEPASTGTEKNVARPSKRTTKPTVVPSAPNSK